jgi:para-nitrobenzyl esterase
MVWRVRLGKIARGLSLAGSVLLCGCGQGIEVVVDTPSGTIKGFESDGVQRFLGIPYAEPPTGSRRWMPPLPKSSWDGVLLADAFGPWCAQFDYERRDEGVVRSGEGWTVFEQVPPNESSSEDCLTLNVFAPADGARPKPVMVFLHGNALGSSFPMFDGTAMAKSGIVFVSINFRLLSLGIFAHPSLTREAPADQPLGRYSQLDRIEALRWVQRHIASFGGDPNEVTLVGISEGGAAILQMLATRDVEGLFHRAIVQSGNGWWWPLQHTEHERLGCWLAKRTGLDGCDATSQDLRSLPWYEIPVTGPYTVDGRNVTAGATQAIEAGDFIDVPLLIGWNDFDGSSLRYEPEQVIDHTHPKVLEAYDTGKRVEDLAYEIYTDLHSGAPARWIAHRFEEGHPSYLYLYSYVVSWDRESARGAEHGYEVPHVFKTWDAMLDDTFPLLSHLILGDDDRAMSEIMHACWVSFIKEGAPSCPGAGEWPAYNREADTLMKLDLTPAPVSGFRAKQLNAQELQMKHYLEQVRTSLAELIHSGD